MGQLDSALCTPTEAEPHRDVAAEAALVLQLRPAVLGTAGARSDGAARAADQLVRVRSLARAAAGRPPSAAASSAAAHSSSSSSGTAPPAPPAPVPASAAAAAAAAAAARAARAVTPEVRLFTARALVVVELAQGELPGV
jgi:hypothetical protein